MPLAPLENIHNQATSGIACDHRFWTSHTIGLHQLWHDIMSLEKKIFSENVGGGMPSSPLDNIQCPTTSGVDAIMAIVQHIQLNNVGGSMLSSPLDNIHYRTVTGMACHHRPLIEHTVRQRREWQSIISLRHYK